MTNDLVELQYWYATKNKSRSLGWGWVNFPKKSSKSTNFLPDFKTKCSLFYFLITLQLVLILKFKNKHCKEMNHIFHYMDFMSKIYQRKLLSVLVDHVLVAAQL